MASRSLLSVLLLLRLCKDTIVSATTTVLFYTDASCKTPYATVQTDTDAYNGQCGEFPTAINSASSIAIDYGCSVTTYTGSSNAFCSYGATNVAVGNCTVMNIGSFSVDCPQLDGTNAPDYTTILASDAGTRSSRPSTASTSTSPVPVSPSPSSQPQSSATGDPSPDPSPPTTLTTTGTPSPDPSSPTTSATGIPSPAPSFTTSSLPGTPTSLFREIGSSSSSTLQSSSSLSSSSSPSSSPSPSQSQKGSGNSGNDGGLSGPSTIALAVVLPGIGIIVAIVFGVNKWKHRPDARPEKH